MSSIFFPGDIAPSIHLANMIPKPACVVPASPLIIQAFLHRAAVELEVVALTACVIDRLSNKFALKWRRECPLVRRDPVSIEYPFTSAHGDCHGSEGDSFPRPEIVALASLMLAAKFLDDRVCMANFRVIVIRLVIAYQEQSSQPQRPSGPSASLVAAFPAASSTPLSASYCTSSTSRSSRSARRNTYPGR
jgi:hypothetical protein